MIILISNRAIIIPIIPTINVPAFAEEPKIPTDMPAAPDSDAASNMASDKLAPAVKQSNKAVTMKMRKYKKA
jgi:hypothetical protein